MSGAKVIGGEKLKAALAKLAAAKGSRVRAGVLEGATYPDGASVATVAGVHEFGDEAHEAKAFMRRTVSDRTDAWKSGFAKQLATNTVEGSLDVLGTVIARDIQKTLKAIGDAGGNSEATIARKGFDKPLMDTGVLSRSISHEVVPGESE